jgi:serine/threonine-protein kinase TNNI3K
VELCIVTEKCKESLLQFLYQEGSNKASNAENYAKWSKRLHVILLEVANGLACLHQKNIIHGDLKSANILLDYNGIAKICDFGLSRLWTSTLQMSLLTGTVGYMAPELMDSNLPRVSGTNRLDIWSMGICCWAALSFKEPFSGEGKNVFWIADFLRRGDRLEIPDYCEDPFKQLILECWSPDPDNRPDAQEIASRLKDLDE